MLEGGECAGAVAVHLAMRAVVKAEDVARSSNGRLRGTSQVSLGAIGDGLQAWNQPLQWPFFPVTRKQRPHYGAVAEFAGRRNDPGIAKTKRRPKPLWRRAQRTGNRVVAKAQLYPDLSLAEPEKIRVRLRVVANEMSTRDSFYHQFRAFAHVPPNQKKCRFGVVAVQQIEQLRSHRRIRPV